MKYSLYAFMLIVLFSCSENTTTSQKEINNILDTWHKAAANSEFDLYFSFFDNQAVFIGTDATENWQVNEFKDFCKPYFDKKKTWDFKPIQRNIYRNNNIAWFDELLDTHMGICRGSGVLEKKSLQLKI